jgi:ADP-ribose pyrophosphatase YjhB (NUDIX family)
MGRPDEGLAYDLRMERRKRVVVHVERRAELLVLDHRDHPEAGTPVPAGGVDRGERLHDAVVREVAEETGVALLAEPAWLGAYDHRDGLGRPARSHFFKVDAPPGLPDAWEHVVGGRGADGGLVLLCRFDPAPNLQPVESVFRT